MYPPLPEASPEVLTLIKAGMSSTLQWFPEDVSLIHLASSLVGLANSDGGVIILGVSPRAGELVGIVDMQATLDKVFQAAILSEPTLVLPMPRQVTAQKSGVGKSVNLLLISVPQGLPHVYSFENRYYERRGNKTDILHSSRLYQLLVERGSIQFETKTIPDASLDDLDITKVTEYAKSVGHVSSEDVEKSYDFLVKRGCLKRIEGKLHVTYAAILLFGRHPQQWLPNATILAGRFPGSQMSDSYIKQDIRGNLPDQLIQAEVFIRENLKTVVRLVGLTHQESLEYPFEAVRELMVNAVAHRDYNLQGDNIHLNIFSGRLEVTSPGTLPGPVTLDNLLEARFARNAIISQVLSDLGYVERLGYGLDRVVYVTEKAGLPPPQFQETAGSFQVVLHAGVQDKSSNEKSQLQQQFTTDELNTRQEMALLYLAKQKRITSHDYHSLCPGVHAETLRRDLVDLVSRGIVIKVGNKKGTYYILKRV